MESSNDLITKENVNLNKTMLTHSDITVAILFQMLNLFMFLSLITYLSTYVVYLNEK